MKKKTAKKKLVKKTVTTTTVTTTTVTTGQLKNRIGIIIDSSGSMASMHNEVVNAFNGQVEVIRKNNQDMDTKVSLVTFSDNTVPVSLNAPVESLKLMERGDFKPTGSTALYDAIGYMITQFQTLPEASDPTCSFLLVIVTDGDENASRSWTYSKVREYIQSLEKTGRWTFTYLGANEGLKDVGTSLGMRASNTMSGQSLRMPGAYATLSANSMKGFMSARVSGQSAVEAFYDTPDTADDLKDKTATTTTTTTVTKPKAGQS
jgi:Mg-chelatase subunit ChlD